MTKVDGYILVFALLLCAVLYAVTQLEFGGPSKVLVVEQDGKRVFSKALGKADGTYQFDFDGGQGALEVIGQSVRMLPMPVEICPNAICSATGFIKSSLSSIVCLPNRLIARIVSSKHQDIDAVSY